MAGVEPSSLETLTFRTLMCQLMPITRSLAQGPACKDLGRNDQSAAITPKALTRRLLRLRTRLEPIKTLKHCPLHDVSHYPNNEYGYH